eukprot:gene9546-9710_t
MQDFKHQAVGANDPAPLLPMPPKLTQLFEFQQQGSPAELPSPQQLAETFLEQSSLLQLRPPVAPGATGSSNYSVIPHQILSWYPRILLFPNFIDKATADHIIALAAPNLKPSTVAYTKNESHDSQTSRTSQGAWLARDDDASGALSGLEAKIAEVTLLPPSHGQPFNVLKYEVGDKNQAHLDTYDPEKFGPQRSQRIATIIIYLNDVEAGGETMFKREGLDGLRRPITDWNSCEDPGAYKVKPRLGDAVLFYGALPDLTIDQQALHASCPVLHGVKWTAVRWLHEKPWQDRTDENIVDV